MKLLIDAGNSRVKWAVYQGESCAARGAAEHHELDALAEAWKNLPLEGAWMSNVAKREVAEALAQAAPCPLHRVHAEKQFGGVCNHYRNTAEQGADRWLAVLAAREICQGDVIVACAGTALTVETLTAEGDYLGGLILPGHGLMLQSLAQGTANLNRQVGEVADFPQGTQDALASGVMAALTGAIEGQRRKLAERTGRGPATVILTGGDAARIAPWLAAPLQIVDNLVLMGLHKVANS
ncbi:type III pantothenate kinase [Chromobacterium sp. IIBBL 290-4]|uniref:type III pantothenate kinase n=1 Tax=Chromobacterium sp. IIBBL 290-4 TaxID=2953890 RepID=UPI0020B6C841|nr:type III pantothenate kinase [Chromobacterium sp. IIBBL 290-4]UTH76172.1 type III pantothenate kinase [Chromobacterium sp. IIBBL 290-4]